MQKAGLKLVFIVLVIVAVILIITAIFIEPINRQSLAEEENYQETLISVDGLQIPGYTPIYQLKAGWATENITPERAAMAGYAPRHEFDSVLDSLYCRVITISNGGTQVSFISLDLLITPPAVRKQVLQLIEESKLNTFPYFAAVHTHNSIGNWDASLAGNIIAGDFRPELINMISQKIISAISASVNNLQTASIETFKIPALELVYNRLDTQASTDGYLRGLKITQSDNKTGYLVTYAAHPTNLPRKSTYLSADYPGRLVTALEKEADFAMFMAGMVGSHGLAGIEAKEVEKIQQAGERLAGKVLANKNFMRIDSSASIQFQHFDLPLTEAALRLGGNWQLRTWVFEKGFGNLQASISLVKIGKLVFLGMPGDFSGELYQNHITGKHEDLQVIITSFNGNFVGYIIDDRHYWSSKKDEVNVMNWLGPHGGEYFADITNRILNILSD